MTTLKQIRDSIKVVKSPPDSLGAVAFRGELIIVGEEFISDHELNPRTEAMMNDRVKELIIRHLYQDRREEMAAALRKLNLADPTSSLQMCEARLAVTSAARYSEPVTQTNFRVGDKVRATDKIERVDKKYVMLPGEIATITAVSSVEDTQIVNIKLLDGVQMVSIVCYDKKPFIPA